MNILGIETSCDETAAAVWLTDHLASNKIASQEVHANFGGVVPELASRAHVKLILPIIQSALSEANINKQDLDGIAVTYGPGLAGSLLVGLNVAKSMALALKVPYIGINHMEGHLFSNSVLEKGPEPPFISLTISGGHTQLVYVKGWGDYKILGKTRDDAAGEAFDKVAKMLELSYPGGPAIDKLAKDGDPEYISLPKAKFKDNSLDFSYSGLKTAVLYHLQNLDSQERHRHKADIAASFQKAAIEVLIENSLKALEEHEIDELALAGGVACNSYLRKHLHQESNRRRFKLYVPPVNLCTDNGAMIARAGYFYLEKGERSEYTLSPKPSLSL
ncbi:tRNA (adenosine(37)-N6)-threonylcarbamoyltransferase complex transferase subunit TsaD [candidate division KSB1 bacterium]|nr:tRNA (adenosine(37)-N6)-threonylcarbamoyltransferase complex transferase subunit TsaD [candidate division KSB1 bacterium]NIR68360.1 tRNA (adenosine(37)-N6)-threonylcarbamoyltransferase complex transferase subunit TsaD [candidate division KSB1 bacterium]NIS22545.1 tRNA (adenosine(37)-N6)-threonylcarbamoyltransferase complex transferase subunit TsaD [candidate division KSB1 bacterium]NIT69381.1 tRNA (adenosine(37)-N6)-threonylcarbamoyltransferase complex transferase subunit TsaD [candidate divi